MQNSFHIVLIQGLNSSVHETFSFRFHLQHQFNSPWCVLWLGTSLLAYSCLSRLPDTTSILKLLLPQPIRFVLFFFFYSPLHQSQGSEWLCNSYQAGLNHNSHKHRLSWGNLSDYAPSPEHPSPLLRKSQAIQNKSMELVSPKWAKHTCGWQRTFLLGQPLAILQDNRCMLGFAALWAHQQLQI